jgi:transcription termination factor Rho
MVHPQEEHMSVLERTALEDSPLADLHAIASELGVDGFRRLRRDALVDAILEHQGADVGADEAGGVGAVDEEAERPRRRRGGRGRGAAATEETAAPIAEDEETLEAPSRRRRGRSRDEREERPAREREDRPARDREERPARERGERPARSEREDRPAAREGERSAEGVVELQPNGSAFLRVASAGPSDDDVYLSAAQVRRCELVAGDRVGGPVRPPRRSERYASLIRVETINGAPADQVSEGVRFDELPAAFPAERFALNAEDPTVKAIEWLTPFGRGSRVTIAGAARAGKTEALRRLADALAKVKGIEVSLVLAGVRPEEIGEWSANPPAPVAPSASLSFAASSDAQAQAVEGAIEHGKRVAARGGDAVVLLDTLDGLQASAARKALAAARNLADSGSLTVIATATAPLGGETTVIALDAVQAAAGRFPALDLLASGTLRPELLVGDAGAAAIAEAYAEAAE